MANPVVLVKTSQDFPQGEASIQQVFDATFGIPLFTAGTTTLTTPSALSRGGSGWKIGTVVGPSNIIFRKSGALSVATDVTLWEYCTSNLFTVKAWYLACKTAPVGANLIVDIMQQVSAAPTWQSIWATNPSHRPTLLDSNNVAWDMTTAAVPDTFIFSASTVFRLDVIQVGSGTAGSDLTVVLFGTASNIVGLGV